MLYKQGVRQIATVGKDAVPVDQVCHSRVSNGTSVVEVRRVPSSDIEVGKATDNNTLIVGPSGLVAMIRTGGTINSITDKALAIDEAHFLEPGPSRLSGIEVRLLLTAGNSVGETSTDGKV
ncbi:hypothetical protein Trco_001665 [Trichoderma cornu-damae]|uniref:Uncharacterized protein n=1 Tax=Trichoderma cornu-damae TaxID=654480 RepID=A0A9P8TYF2_9HYPO|nr:hypothetical protein Trco_001665 [Trichoderma cornu-damae]